MDNPYHHPDIKTHKIDTEKARSLIFEIFNIIIAGQSLIGNGYYDDDEEIDNELSELHKLHYKVAENTLSDKLLKLAIYIRTLDDIYSDYVDAPDYIKKRDELEGGEQLGYVHQSDKKINLNIRETCNKIIHAFDIHPIYDSDDDRDKSPKWGMTGEIEFEGKKFGKKWGIVINTIDYLETTLSLLQIVDELET